MRIARGADLILLPSSLVALALLALNDHVLKATSPGFWTGKLSDFAGLYFFPFLLFALVSLPWRRGESARVLALCSLATGLGFALVNLSSAVSTHYEHWVELIWHTLGRSVHLRHVADAEDLMALPMVAIAYLVGAAHLRTAPEHPAC